MTDIKRLEDSIDRFSGAHELSPSSLNIKLVQIGSDQGDNPYSDKVEKRKKSLNVQSTKNLSNLPSVVSRTNHTSPMQAAYF